MYFRLPGTPILGGIVVAAVLLYFLFPIGWLSPGQDEFYIFRNMTGADLPPGQILAEEGQKGVTREIHAQGWYFFNKLTHRAEVSKVTEVGTDQICILKQESGDPLPEGRILAPVRRQPDGTLITNAMGLPESQFKGELEEYLGPGKYRIHPYMYKVRLVSWSQVGAGQVGVLTRLDGLPLPAGEFIAPVKRDQQGQVLLKDGIPQSAYKGILEEVLKPGNYRVHPGLYKFETVPAVKVEAGFVGIVTARTGAPMPEGHLLASEGQRGVQEKVLSPGTYYLNPAMYTVDLVSIQSHIAEFLDDKGATPHATEVIDFPSNDGFHIKIDVAVEWRVNADKVAEVFTRLGNIKEIETKVTMPNTRSIARVEGSKYNAKDFIQGEARERFERVFFADLQRVCADKGVEILRGMVRKIQVPEEIAKPIRDAEIANQELLRNQQEKLRANSAAEKMEAETRINQRKQQIEAETAKKVAETQAQQRLAVAEVNLQTAKREAEAALTLGKAEADVIFFKKEAEAKGVQVMTTAFGGGDNLARYELAKGMAANTSFVWLPANEGTFWGGTLDDLQKWLVKQQRPPQAEQRPAQVGTKSP
jgi:hypothetical protein